MDSIRKLDAERICRVCLQEKTDLYLIFDEAFAEGGTPISVILTECTRYRVERHDELPHQMCGDCMESARSAYRFKRLTEQSYLTLLTVLDVKVRPNHKTNEWADISTQTDQLAIHPCEICGKQFFSEVDVREHRFIEHRGADKNCRLCGESFQHIRKLRSHLSLMHPDEGTVHDIKCPLCHKQFSRKDHMKRHLRVIHKQSTKSVSTKTELVTVDVDMKPNASTKTEPVEVDMKQDESTKTDLVHVDLKVDNDVDHDWGSIKDDLPDEDDSMLGDTKPQEPQAGSSKTLVRKYLSCSLCSDKFVQKVDLLNHIRNIHKKSPESRLPADPKKCQVCGETFKLRRLLKRHLAFEHPNEGLTNDMKCLICQRQFSRNEHMKRHMATVHGENYECSKVSLEEPEIDFMSDIAQREVANTISTNMLQWHGLDNVTPDICDDAEMDAIDPFSSGDEQKVKTANKPQVNIKVEPTDGFKSDSSDNSFANDLELECDANAIKKLKESSCESDDDNKPIADLSPKPKVKIIREYLEKKVPARRRVGIKNAENRCTECQRTFSRHSHMLRHMLSHVADAEKPHACPNCGKRFTRSDHLKTHIMNVHQTKEFKCDQCKLAFARNEELTRHIEARHGQEPNAHKIHDCEFCHKKFTSKTYLRKHILMHTDRIFACKFCDQTYKDRTACKDHEKTHSVERKFLCSVCGESFARNDYLRVHMRRHTGEKPYKCQYCGKGFPRATDVKMHERYHTGTKPKVCQLCGKAFHRAYNLTIHMRTHTGERPFKCDQCPKSFTQSNDLKAHTRRHTGERFKCSECDAAFLQLYGLRQHALGVHGIQIESTTGRLQKFPPILVVEHPLELHLQHSLQQPPADALPQHLQQSLQSPPADTLPPRIYTD